MEQRIVQKKYDQSHKFAIIQILLSYRTNLLASPSFPINFSTFSASTHPLLYTIHLDNPT